MEKKENYSRTFLSAAKTLHAALEILKLNSNQLNSKDLIIEIEKKVSLSEWEKERYEKTGYIRWQSLLHFFSIDATKAGFIRKNKGVWYLTPEGEEAIKKNPLDFLTEAKQKYLVWKKNTQSIEPEISDEGSLKSNQYSAISIQQAEEDSFAVIKAFIREKNPYEFQDMVAALLRGMGYYTPFVAPKGKDGGIDIIAYQDPLGARSPRIKCQVKHRLDSPSTVKEVRELVGVMAKEGEIAIFVSSGGFSSDAKVFSRDSSTHVELIDLEKFIALWIDFYDKMVDEDKKLMPLRPVFFLDLDDTD